MWSEEPPTFKERQRRTGYVCEELYMWHNAKCLSFDVWTQPLEHWENPESKSRCNGLLEVSGIKDCLVKVKARKASVAEVLRFHTEEYVARVQALSLADGGDAGEVARMSKGGYDIALFAVGGVLAAVEAILLPEEDERRVENAYCLVRPPGHHAERDRGMGFCIFNNIVLGAQHARALWRNSQHFKEGGGNMRIAIVDYDVHHGNGTQQAFWEDPDTLFVSIHQDSNYPLHTGSLGEVGSISACSDGAHTTINLPLPPGSGKGAYEYAFDQVVVPALRRFSPDMIFVSSGFDASYADPLAAMMLSAEDYRAMTRKLMRVADEVCGGRLLFSHEGGYSKDYVPFCCLAVVEELCGGASAVDHSYGDVHEWGYQELQPHQAAVVDAAAALAGLSSGGPPLGAGESERLSAQEARVASAMSELLGQVQGNAGSGVDVADRRRAVLQHLLSLC